MRTTPSRPRIGLVLSGGGARGAYEAGVLAWVIDELPKRLGRPVQFDLLTGTSVGAIHACFLAAHGTAPGTGQRLIALWEALDVTTVYEFHLGNLLAAPLRILGFGRAPHEAPRLSGLLDTAPLERLVTNQIPWPRLRERIDASEVDALAVSGTQIATGRTVVWVDSATPHLRGWSHDPYVVSERARISADHALASAAIPMVFPARHIDGDYYCDGGLRLNTPLAPALRLGADRLLIVGLTPPPPTDPDVLLRQRREAEYGSAAYMLGKVLNVLLLDPVEYDVGRLRLTNAILEDGACIYGSEFADRISNTVVARRGAPYRIVPHAYLRPSQNLGSLAVECLRHEHPVPRSVHGWLSRATMRLARQGVSTEADLLSYLMFDRCFAAHLIALGQADAAANADALLAVFADA